jgi:hypothetical protein
MSAHPALPGLRTAARGSAPGPAAAGARPWIEHWLETCRDLSELKASHPMMDAAIEEIDGRMIRVGEHWLADFASCNYLGFDLDRQIIDAVPAYLDAWGTHPVSGAIGVQATLVAAGALGAVVTFCALLLPGMRDVEGSASLEHGSEHEDENHDRGHHGHDPDQRPEGLLLRPQGVQHGG